jgi:hypothetical protein
MRTQVLSVAWFLAMTANLAPGGEVEMKRLETEAPAAFQRLIQGYSRLKAEGVLTLTRKGSRTSPGKVTLSDVSIAVLDDREKVGLKFFSLDPAGVRRYDREKVLCRGLNADFTLDRGHKTQENYVLTNMQGWRNVGQGQTSVKITIDNQGMRFARSPFEFYFSVQELIARKKLRILSSDSLKVDGQNVLRYKATNAPPGDGRTTVTFELLPDHGWAIHHAELEADASPGPGKAQHKLSIRDAITVEYGYDQQGLPIPRRVRSENNFADHLFEFREFTLAANTPESEFSMNHYGIPDATLPIAAVNRPNYLLFGAFFLGLVSLVGSISLWRRKPKTGVER